METNPKSKITRNITGLLLCAGLSGRMGTTKALMLHKGLPFAVLIIRKLLLVCRKVIVVVGHESEKVKTEIKKYLKQEEMHKVKFVLNENYEDGMFSSLQYGLKYISEANWMLYHFVDQPCISNSFYEDFVLQLSNDVNWLQPSYNNKLGHPILFDKKVSSIILNQAKNRSLRDLSIDTSIKKQIWNCCHPEILQDIDTIEEFKRLKLALR